MRFRRELLSILFLFGTGFAHAWPADNAPWAFVLHNIGGNCGSLDPATSGAPPVDYGASFEGSVRPLLVAEMCATCHGSAGEFNINGTEARMALIIDADTGLETGRAAAVQPQQAATPMLRVKPGDPYQSSVFGRLNCESPPAFWPESRLWKMPANGLTASIELQAAVHDWIALGALMPDTGGDRLFLGTFETITRR